MIYLIVIDGTYDDVQALINHREMDMGHTLVSISVNQPHTVDPKKKSAEFLIAMRKPKPESMGGL
jgi:hypothetical protein